MSAICVVQARTGSTRLPRKVLADLGGMPMLTFLLRRLAPLRGDGTDDVDRIVVATTDRDADDEIADLAHDERVDVVRGPEEDVLARFALVLDTFPTDTVVRVTADCPFTDPQIVRAALTRRDKTGADYVSNTLVRTFPDGLDVEVVTTAALRVAATEAIDPVEREHVTPFVYRRPDRFALRNLRLARRRTHTDLGARRWTVDTPEDLDFARHVVAQLGCADFAWIAALPYRRRDELGGAPFSLRPAVPGDSTLLRVLRNAPDSVRWSRNGRPVERDEHATWFARVLACPASRVWVARQDGRGVGQVRLDVHDGVGTVSLTVSAADRRRGFGIEILRSLGRALGADEQTHTLAAWIHRDNVPSLGVFGEAGFVANGEEEAGYLRYEVRTAALTSSSTRPT